MTWLPRVQNVDYSLLQLFNIYSKFSHEHGVTMSTSLSRTDQLIQSQPTDVAGAVT